ncbi:MAG: hypothetical protein ABFC63_07155 [Thermoguttaceae bacterium]
MQASLLDKLTDAVRAVGGDALGRVLSAAVVVVALWIAWCVIRRLRRPAVLPPPNLQIEVTSLSELGPPAGLPAIEFYNLPVRVAAVVLAPVGPHSELPSDEQLDALLAAVLPGLDQIVTRHRPVIRRWPHQVSARGFARLLFSNAKLPGNYGKGTPWSSVAGMARVEGQPVMVGMVLRAASANSLGQTVIEAEHQWLGCLRVRWS